MEIIRDIQRGREEVWKISALLTNAMSAKEADSKPRRKEPLWECKCD
jgi:hypothetical protein